jgi:hypothetical protein
MGGICSAARGRITWVAGTLRQDLGWGSRVGGPDSAGVQGVDGGHTRAGRGEYRGHLACGAGTNQCRQGQVLSTISRGPTTPHFATGICVSSTPHGVRLLIKGKASAA